MPAGAFLVVLFDGQGAAADDLNFGDNVATLHSPPWLTNIFEDGADQVALYRATFSIYLPLCCEVAVERQQPATGRHTSAGIISFVAWGAEPEVDAAGAADAGIWREDWYVSLSRGSGVRNDVFATGQSIGLLPDQAITYPGEGGNFPGDGGHAGERRISSP